MATNKAPPTAAKRGTRTRKGLRGYFHRANLLTSLVLIFPLFLFYQLAVVELPDVGNGADLISGLIARLSRSAGVNRLVLDLALLVLFLLALLVMRKRQQFDTRLFVPVVIESAIYALLMGSVITYVMNLLGISPQLAIHALANALIPFAATTAETVKQAGVLSRIAMSLGAGVNEELVFRLAMIPPLTWLLHEAMSIRRGISLALAFVISSLLFSAAHHVIGGEPWHLAPFVYRFFCGIIFALLFQFRGLAVAVYTHALYDVYVMLFR